MLACFRTSSVITTNKTQNDWPFQSEQVCSEEETRGTLISDHHAQQNFINKDFKNLDTSSSKICNYRAVLIAYTCALC